MTNKGKKIVVIGGGFSGLAAVARLRQLSSDNEILLIDKEDKFEFRPLFPDIISSRIKEKYLAYDLKKFAAAKRVEFIKDEVVGIGIGLRKVELKSQSIFYDYLIVAAGATNNFYGNKTAEANFLKLYSVKDALLICEKIKNSNYDNLVIIGGGYTGVEIATNLWRYFKKSGREGKKIYIIERGTELLANLPVELRNYTLLNLQSLGIQIVAKAALKEFKSEYLVLDNEMKIEKPLVIWAAGVKAADFIDKLETEKGPQGRIKVDEYLRFNENCFAIGDAVHFESAGKPLRMAVQFSFYQGICAAENVIRLIKNKGMKKFKPLDLGYIIPMANGKSCGFVFNRKIFGIIPSAFHYLMCIYRSIGLENKWGILTEVLRDRL